MKKSAYEKLLEIAKTTYLYSGIELLLYWDQETYLPKKGIENRIEQLELLAALIHKEQTSKTFAENLGALIDLETGKFLDPKLTFDQKANLREFRRDYLKAVKLPSSFVQEFTKVTSTAMHAWREAKDSNDFASFSPHLEKVVKLCKEKAKILGYDDHPYDALLDEFEPTTTTAALTRLLTKLKISLTNLLKKIKVNPSSRIDFFHKTYSHDKQMNFGKKILGAMGFDKSFSRLDESTHPMCLANHPHDVRLTTRIFPNQPQVNILSAIHEGGHGLYYAHLPLRHMGTPLGEPASHGINESQSRIWETIIGRSHAFWKYFFPLLQKEFPENLTDVKLEEFYYALNLVKPSLIRTDSDEVSYNLHIIIRFELEKALLEGSLAVKDLAEAWNEKMRESLGIIPKAHSEGCLQDIHWAMGAIGYFPTYALGNLYAAQFFETFAKEHTNWKEKVAKGELLFISNWLKEKVHSQGRKYLPEDLCKKITGKPLTEKPFLNYLENKYKPLYNL